VTLAVGGRGHAVINLGTSAFRFELTGCCAGRNESIATRLHGAPRRTGNTAKLRCLRKL
jgi:hypothetical protein